MRDHKENVIRELRDYNSGKLDISSEPSSLRLSTLRNKRIGHCSSKEAVAVQCVDGWKAALAERRRDTLNTLAGFGCQARERFKHFLVSHTGAKISPAIRLELHLAKLFLFRIS